MSEGRKPSTAPGNTPKLYRVTEAMAQLSISRATLYRMVAAGKLRLVKVGLTGSRITAESIEAVIGGNDET